MDVVVLSFNNIYIYYISNRKVFLKFDVIKGDYICGSMKIWFLGRFFFLFSILLKG